MSWKSTRLTGKSVIATKKVQYHNLQLQTRIKTYIGWTAQIVQHEIDHCESI
ncbi:MAG: peptide deformylase [Oscillospiraceae bacterium]|nr:peptide deformylase [Oscillospiraceae bacterium]